VPPVIRTDTLLGPRSDMEDKSCTLATEEASHQWLAGGGNQMMKSYIVKSKRQYRELMQLLADEGYRWLHGTVHDTAGGDPLPVDGPYVITTRGDNHTIWWRLPEWARVPGEGLPLSYEKWHAVTRTKWLKAKGDNHE